MVCFPQILLGPLLNTLSKCFMNVKKTSLFSNELLEFLKYQNTSRTLAKQPLRLNSKRQGMNILAFCFGDISVPLVGVVFKDIDKIKQSFYKSSFDVRSSSVTSLILQCSFQIANASEKVSMYFF